MIVAIDPGISTGMAIRLSNGHFATVTIVNGFQGICDILKERKEAVELIVVEDFLGIQRQSRDGIATMKLIGAIQALGYLAGIPIILQTPSQRMGDDIRARDMLRERKKEQGHSFTDHERSALAHLLFYERRKARQQQQEAKVPA